MLELHPKHTIKQLLGQMHSLGSRKLWLRQLQVQMREPCNNVVPILVKVRRLLLPGIFVFRIRERSSATLI